MALNTAGKAMVAVAGFVWGLARIGYSERVERQTERADRQYPATPLSPSPSKTVRSTLVYSAETERFVTESRLAEALEQTENRIRNEVSATLKTQAVAVASLREMVEGTDALLERVLERLEEFADRAAQESGAQEPIAPERTTSRVRASAGTSAESRFRPDLRA